MLNQYEKLGRGTLKRLELPQREANCLADLTKPLRSFVSVSCVHFLSE
ncbi:hypothetical protein YSA_05006 [Pseudomonas putida ND6]|uniref:Uncharacterized protein n=1 Tax=Pseudomonas putida ND6 TaxID=231023 RepID=I3UVF4_PSEPU|nr:hypothetical protein YSA_05006 [Pseudomonas putida ND6]